MAMNVIYVLNSTDPFGGATKSFLPLLNGLVRQGVKPQVVVPNGDGIVRELRARDITCIVLNYRPATYPYHASVKDFFLFVPRLFGRLWVNAIAASRLARRLRTQAIDLIHTNVSVIDIGARAARHLRIPHIYHIREYGDRDFREIYMPCTAAFRASLRQPHTHTICITRDIQAHFHLSGISSSIVINDPVLSRQDTHTSWAAKEHCFLFAGRLEPVKGLEDLLEAYADYVNQCGSPWPLYVAGKELEKSYGDRVRHFVQVHALGTHIHFLGMRSDLNAIMQRSAVVIVPSRFEGFGRCMPEAMQNGCLVVGRDNSGTREQFDNGVRQLGREIGLRFHDNHTLCSSLLAITAHPERFSAMAHDGFVVANALYAHEISIEKVMQFYHSIIDETTH